MTLGAIVALRPRPRRGALREPEPRARAGLVRNPAAIEATAKNAMVIARENDGGLAGAKGRARPRDGERRCFFNVPVNVFAARWKEGEARGVVVR